MASLDDAGNVWEEIPAFVLRGRPTVRLHDGDRVLAEGDVVPFPRGPEGGHTPSSTRGLTREPQQSSATRHSLLGTAA